MIVKEFIYLVRIMISSMLHWGSEEAVEVGGVLPFSDRFPSSVNFHTVQKQHNTYIFLLLKAKTSL